MGKIKGALGQGVISVVDPQTGTKVFPASVHVIQQRGKPSQRLIKQKLKPQGEGIARKMSERCQQ